MQSLKRVILYGIGLWLLLVAVSLILFSLEERDDALFESVKFIVLAGSTVWLTVLYLRKVIKSSLGEGLAVGVTWLAIGVLLDMVLFSLGLFNIGLGDYFKDVASSYLIMPIVTTLILHFLRAKRFHPSEEVETTA